MAFCPHCGNEMSASSGQCPTCHRFVPAHPGFPSSQPPVQTIAAYAAPTYDGPSGGFIPPGFAQPRIPLRPGALRIVLWTAAVMLLIFVGIASLFVRYLSKVGDAAQQAAIESVHFKSTLENLETMYGIRGVAQVDAKLLQLLTSASNQLAGTLDGRLDNRAQLIRDYVSIAQNVDTKSCPSSFVDAYKRHLSLWSDLAQVYASHPHIPSEEEAFVTRILQNLTGDASSGAIERQEIVDWARRAEDAGKRADQGNQEFLEAAKTAMDSVGKDADTSK